MAFHGAHMVHESLAEGTFVDWGCHVLVEVIAMVRCDLVDGMRYFVGDWAMSYVDSSMVSYLGECSCRWGMAWLSCGGVESHCCSTMWWGPVGMTRSLE